jgi:Coenzyme PQQ synthesis protein D (PqqD)
LSDAQRLRLNSPAVITESIDGEALVVNLESGCYYSLRGPAEEIWTLLLAGATAEEAAAAIAPAYGTNPETARSGVDALLEQLLADALVVDREDVTPDDTPVLRGGAWAQPALEKYTDMQELLALDPVHDVDAEAGWPNVPAAGARPA